MKTGLQQASQRPWLISSVIGASLVVSLSPLLLKAPATGVSSLLDRLDSDSSSLLGREVAAQTLRLLFASQPWSRPQISERATQLPWGDLLHSARPRLVEHSACLLADVGVWNSSAVLDAPHSLAAALPRPACAAACQKCIISSLGQPEAAILQWGREPFSPAAQHILLQWAGLQPLEDLAALKLIDFDTSNVAAALVTNEAATPGGRAGLLSMPSLPAARLLRDLQGALQLSAVPRRTAVAARAARLLGNLVQDRLSVDLLQATGTLEPLLQVHALMSGAADHAVHCVMHMCSPCCRPQHSLFTQQPGGWEAHHFFGQPTKGCGAKVLLRRIAAAEPETLPACAIALGNLAAGSRRARLALQAMRGPSTLAAAARDSSSGAAHMALLQALLAVSQVGPGPSARQLRP